MSGDDSIKKETSSRRKVAMWRLMELAEPEYPLIAVSLAGLAVNAATNISFPHILGRAVDHFSTSKRDDKFLYLAGSVFAIGSTASWIRVYYMGIATERIATRLRKMLFDSFMEKDVAFFDSSKTGELVTILEDDVDAAAEALTVNLASGLRSLNSSVNGSIMLLLRSATLTCVSLSVVPIIGVGAMGMRSLVKKHREKLREMQGDVLNFAIERFTSMSTVKLNGREETEMRRFERFSDRGLVLAKKMHFLDGATMSFISAGMNVGLLAVLFKGGQLIGSGSMSAGDLTQFALQSGPVGLGFSQRTVRRRVLHRAERAAALVARVALHDQPVILRGRQARHRTRHAVAHVRVQFPEHNRVQQGVVQKSNLIFVPDSARGCAARGAVVGQRFPGPAPVRGESLGHARSAQVQRAGQRVLGVASRRTAGAGVVVASQGSRFDGSRGRGRRPRGRGRHVARIGGHRVFRGALLRLG